MKKLKTFFVILLVMLALCITDFSLSDVPWDHEISKVRTVYPDIAIDLIYPHSKAEIIPWKLSKKRLTKKP